MASYIKKTDGEVTTFEILPDRPRKSTVSLVFIIFYLFFYLASCVYPVIEGLTDPKYQSTYGSGGEGIMIFFVGTGLVIPVLLAWWNGIRDPRHPFFRAPHKLVISKSEVSGGTHVVPRDQIISLGNFVASHFSYMTILVSGGRKINVAGGIDYNTRTALQAEVAKLLEADAVSIEQSPN